MRMAHLGISAVHRLQVQLDMPFYRDRDEEIYVVSLDVLIRNYSDGRTSRPGTLTYSLLDDPYDRLPFLIWPRIWRDAVKYEAKYLVGEVDEFLVAWRSCEFFIFSPEEWAELYIWAPNWRKEFKPCCTLLFLMGLLFSYLPNTFFNDLSRVKTLYRAVVVDQCTTAQMVPF